MQSNNTSRKGSLILLGLSIFITIITLIIHFSLKGSWGNVWRYCSSYLTIAIITFLVGVACFVIPTIHYSVSKEKENALIHYYDGVGKNDIETIKSFLSQHNRGVNRSTSSSYEYIKDCLYNAILLCENKIKSQISKNGYEKQLKLCNDNVIYYNEKKALIYFSHYSSRDVSMKNNKICYQVYGHNFFSMKELTDFFCNLLKDNAYQELAAYSCSLDQLFWYTKGGNSTGYTAADAAAGAIVGGLLLGPVGVLLGAGSAASDNKKANNEKQVVFGVHDQGSWIITKYEFQYESTVTLLSEHFPDNRLNHVYNKTLT